MRGTYAGAGPALSETLGAWLVATNGGSRLRVADDELGRQLWPTADEAEGIEKEAHRARAEWPAERLRSLGVDPDDI